MLLLGERFVIALLVMLLLDERLIVDRLVMLLLGVLLIVDLLVMLLLGVLLIVDLLEMLLLGVRLIVDLLDILLLELRLDEILRELPEEFILGAALDVVAGLETLRLDLLDLLDLLFERPLAAKTGSQNNKRAINTLKTRKSGPPRKNPLDSWLLYSVF